MELVKKVAMIISGELDLWLKNEQLRTLLLELNTSVKFVSRIFNNGADQLAKDGALRPKVFSSWVIGL